MNPHRGEVALGLDGDRLPMRLTLGALAELEAELGVSSLADMVARFEDGNFSSQDLIALLGAGLRGAGWRGDNATLANAQIEGGPVGATRAAAALLTRAFQGAEPAPEAPEPPDTVGQQG